MVHATPYQEVQERLRPHLGERTELLPRKWERLGDVLVVRLPEELRADGTDVRLIGESYAETLSCRVVLDDRNGIQGPLRQPGVVRLFGDGPGETVVRQNGIAYRLDPERVMFSSGNLQERLRMAEVEARDETVVDLFAGIGYFTIPLLAKAAAERVIACELNPVSAGYLRQNAEENGVADRLEVREGDCREVAPEGVAQRVVLGYFPGGCDFLDTAFRTLGPEGGTIHYHDTAKADKGGFTEELVRHMEPVAREHGYRIVRHVGRQVKHFAPGVVHAVLDAEVRPR